MLKTFLYMGARTLRSRRTGLAIRRSMMPLLEFRRRCQPVEGVLESASGSVSSIADPILRRSKQASIDAVSRQVEDITIKVGTRSMARGTEAQSTEQGGSSSVKTLTAPPYHSGLDAEATFLKSALGSMLDKCCWPGQVPAPVMLCSAAASGDLDNLWAGQAPAISDFDGRTLYDCGR